MVWQYCNMQQQLLSGNIAKYYSIELLGGRHPHHIAASADSFCDKRWRRQPMKGTATFQTSRGFVLCASAHQNHTNAQRLRTDRRLSPAASSAPERTGTAVRGPHGSSLGLRWRTQYRLRVPEQEKVRRSQFARQRLEVHDGRCLDLAGGLQLCGGVGRCRDVQRAADQHQQYRPVLPDFRRHAHHDELLVQLH